MASEINKKMAQHNMQMFLDHDIDKLRTDAGGMLQVKSGFYRFFTRLFGLSKKECEKTKSVIEKSILFAMEREQNSPPIYLRIQSNNDKKIAGNMGCLAEKIGKIFTKSQPMLPLKRNFEIDASIRTEDATQIVFLSLCNQNEDMEVVKQIWKDFPEELKFSSLCEGIQIAAKQNNDEMVDFLLSKVGEAQTSSSEKKTQLFNQALGLSLEHACKNNNEKMVKEIVSKMESVQNNYLLPAVIKAIENNNTKIAMFLLENEKSVFDIYTSKMLVCDKAKSKGLTEVVEFLNDSSTK